MLNRHYGLQFSQKMWSAYYNVLQWVKVLAVSYV